MTKYFPPEPTKEDVEFDGWNIVLISLMTALISIFPLMIGIVIAVELFDSESPPYEFLVMSIFGVFVFTLISCTMVELKAYVKELKKYRSKMEFWNQQIKDLTRKYDNAEAEEFIKQVRK